MTAPRNRVGITRIWKTLEGKNVKTNDGKDLGEIKKISEEYLLLQKGIVHKEEFWIPKYISDAFDGKILWLLLSEEEVRGKYQYGKEPPTNDKYAKEFESFKGSPYGQKVNYSADFHEKIQFVENYKNIRDINMAASPESERYGLTPRLADEHTLVQKSVERSKENERKEKDNVLKAETAGVTKYAQVVQPSTTESKSAETKVRNSDSANSSPIRPPSLKTGESETFVKVTDEHITSASIDSNTASPVRITLENIIPQSMASTPPGIAKSSVSSSSPSPIHTSDEHKETVPKPSALELDSTNKEGKANDNSLPNAGAESTAVMVATSTSTSTSITPDKEIDKKPVLAEPMLALKVAKATEEQIVPISEKNGESKLLVLKTQTPSSQITFQGDRTETKKEHVDSKLDYYFNPFLAGMAMWQGWLDMYNEFVAINIRLSLNWLNSYRNY
ncbi:MAG: hypothetical protein WBF33_15410 [Candidatus Nitrosopolaris sp.]